MNEEDRKREIISERKENEMVIMIDKETRQIVQKQRTIGRNRQILIKEL